MDDVLAIPQLITAHADAELTSVACLQRAPLPSSAAPAAVRPSPRPDIRLGTGSGSLRGSKRKQVTRVQPPVAVPAPAPAVQATTSTSTVSAPSAASRALKLNAREVFWTDMRCWFKATVRRLRRGHLATVRYDAHGNYTRAADLVYVHDMHDVRWRYCT